METEVGPVHAFLETTVKSFKQSLGYLDMGSVVWSLIGIALVFLIRKPLSALSLVGFKALLARFGVNLSDDVEAQLKSAAEILFVTLAVYVAIRLAFPTDETGLFLTRVLSSVAIVTVFGAWYRLSGPFASLLRDDTSSLVASETDWVERVTQFAVILFGLTSLLKVWQIDISGALTGVGVLGAGLAIATQDLLRNLVAGMTNISEKRFETGDAIQVEGQFVGTVRRIDLRSTLVVGFDQIPRHIPNSDLSNSIVLNYSALKHRRIMLKVPLQLSATQSQIEAVRDGIRHHHRTSGDFELGDDAPKHIFVSDFGPSSIDILIYVWTRGPNYQEYLQVTERLTLAILSITRNAGTTLAYPTQTVKLDASMESQGLQDNAFSPNS
ncbi:mechanosensitive ion channel family protein [Ruegeria faecimaris]|uniref:mechanosensitive ion channel family protein n=1 Tax=Ruegeria faecimaris TaxID=686389 RepID=UPI0024936BC9|nr:mechanosensitive ion channel family protein [Ruegeria faecimaris]